MPVTGEGMVYLLDWKVPDGGRWHHACDRWRDGLAVGQVGSE
jgi:hypothetical protein